MMTDWNICACRGELIGEFLTISYQQTIWMYPFYKIFNILSVKLSNITKIDLLFEYFKEIFPQTFFYKNDNTIICKWKSSRVNMVSVHCTLCKYIHSYPGRNV